jgi:16S rRNA (guanine966-N2)-methyltransferase
MSLSILGGIAKGFRLKVPKNDEIRPTSVLLKRRIFDSFQDHSGIVFIDLCAGTGAIGFESWSRGAKEVHLIESGKKVCKNLQDNISKINQSYIADGKERKINFHQCDALKWLKNFQSSYVRLNENEKTDTIIFLDPPYRDKETYNKIIDYLKQGNWYYGKLWIESDRQIGLTIDELDTLLKSALKTFTQGTSFIYMVEFGASE